MKLLDEDARRLAGTSIAGAALGWWPAFTLGVYGVVFFEQHLALWAAATSALLALGSPAASAADCAPGTGTTQR